MKIIFKVTGFLGLGIWGAAFAFDIKGEYYLTASYFLIFIGVIGWARSVFLSHAPGIQNQNTWVIGISSRKYIAYFWAVIITGFYVLLYWFPKYLGYNYDEKNTGIVALFDPLSYLLNGKKASQWFVYGSVYTLSILVFGVKFILKYRHSKYQIWRTLSVIFFQLFFAYLIPEFLTKSNPGLPYFDKDLKNMWPLNYYYFQDYHLDALFNSGTLGLSFFTWAMLLIFIISPFLTYKYGKRWYCSWVCGCGGLAETTGDDFRHLSNKTQKAWNVERYLSYSILVLVFIITIAVIYSYLISKSTGGYQSALVFVGGVIFFLATFLILLNIKFKAKLNPKALKIANIVLPLIVLILIVNVALSSSNIFFIDSYKLRSWYGFYVGAAFSGVIGVGLYPLLGSRVWCRFGCPMAAILGLQQKLLSKFRITTNSGQCISCGNCSTYCEMGIDVRMYAQEGKDIVRASCVGCGICSAVCPRGVLKLENM